MILPCLLGLAMGADPGAYPFAIDLDLPPGDLIRIDLDAGAIGIDPDHLEEGLSVRGADGEERAYAVVRSTDAPLENRDRLTFRPTSATTWSLSSPEHPLNAVDLDIQDLAQDGPFRAIVRRSDGQVVGSGLVYQVFTSSGDEVSQRRVTLRQAAGPLSVELLSLRSTWPRLTGTWGVYDFDLAVPLLEETFPLADAVLTEGGRSRWSVPLGGPRRIVGLKFEVEGDIFERSVQAGHPSVDGAPELSIVGTIRRLALAGNTVDHTEISGMRLDTDTLVIEIDTDRARALPVRSVTVQTLGATLVVRAPGPAPQRLLLGGIEPDSPHDLGFAALDLLMNADARVTAGPMAPNPDFDPRASREALDVPGTPVNLVRFKWSRQVEGEPGWVRLLLDRAVLAHAREDLGDLRLVDPAGNQIPFLLQRTGAELPWEIGTPELSQVEDQTRIRVPLGREIAPVSTVTLFTKATIFSRTVTILRNRGNMTEPLRTIVWSGLEQGSATAIDVHQTVGDTLLIRIENGDNPPIDIDRIEVTWPEVEIRARIPEAGARLVYGAPSEWAPSYDLMMLEEELRRMPVAGATLGPEEADEGPVLAGGERLAVLGAIGLLVLGLLAMTMRVLKEVPAPAPMEDPKAS